MSRVLSCNILCINIVESKKKEALGMDDQDGKDDLWLPAKINLLKVIAIKSSGIESGILPADRAVVITSGDSWLVTDLGYEELSDVWEQLIENQ